MSLEKLSRNEKEKVSAGKLKWLCFQVEHEHIEEILNGLETSPYEFYQLLDGNIWCKLVVRKREKKGVVSGKVPS